MRDGRIVIDYQSYSPARPWLENIPLWVVILIFLFREKKQWPIIIPTECLLIEPPLSVTCRVHLLIDNDLSCRHGIRVRSHRVVRSSE